ncbi:MAG: T9SS type A sorting domain-containing protein [Chitinophagaceae bacterium]|nr:MAG: T9SS type A sorting domain-containing protein [Chitinophagaceae bacterium]
MVHPNPATDVLHISVSQFNDQADVELQDIKGSILLKTKMKQSTQQLDLSGMNPGLYILKYNDGDHSKTVKFIKR